MCGNRMMRMSLVVVLSLLDAGQAFSSGRTGPATTRLYSYAGEYLSQQPQNRFNNLGVQEAAPPPGWAVPPPPQDGGAMVYAAPPPQQSSQYGSLPQSPYGGMQPQQPPQQQSSWNAPGPQSNWNSPSSPSSFQDQSSWYSPMSPNNLMNQSPSHYSTTTTNYGKTIQGNSRQTLSQLTRHPSDGVAVNVASTDRHSPVVADVNLWNGPDNTPASMKLYSEDGNARPWKAHVGGIGSTAHGSGWGSGQTSMDVRNAGPMEFPMTASLQSTSTPTPPIPAPANPYFQSSSPNINAWPDVNGGSISRHRQLSLEPAGSNAYPPLDKTNAQNVQGGELKYFSVTGTGSTVAVQIELFSEGLPINAKVELLQGPNTVKQCGDIYVDNGRLKPFSAVLDLPGNYPCTIEVRNTGPVEYPFYARVTPVAGVRPPQPDQPPSMFSDLSAIYGGR